MGIKGIEGPFSALTLASNKFARDNIIKNRRPDYTVGQDKAVMQSWVIWSDGVRTLEMHRILRPDRAECFHTHPAHAMRMVVEGGYTEQIMDECGKRYKDWHPGSWGIVPHDLCHRIHKLIDGPSVSLWWRGPRAHNVRLLGKGWGDRDGEEIVKL